MVIQQRSEEYERRKRAEERLNRPEDVQKEAFLSELRKESASVICLAMMYAKNFEETGEDLTQKLINVNENAHLLQRIYNKGYEDGFAKGQKGEK